MIKCEFCDNHIKITPEIAPPGYKFRIDGWAFCQDCKIKLIGGVDNG